MSSLWPGTLPCPELGSLPILMELYVQHNFLTGEIDESLRQNGVLRKFVSRVCSVCEWPREKDRLIQFVSFASPLCRNIVCPAQQLYRRMAAILLPSVPFLQGKH